MRIDLLQMSGSYGPTKAQIVLQSGSKTPWVRIEQTGRVVMLTKNQLLRLAREMMEK